MWWRRKNEKMKPSELANQIYANIHTAPELPERVCVTEYMCDAHLRKCVQECEFSYLDHRMANLMLARMLESDGIKTVFVSVIPEEYFEWLAGEENTPGARAMYANEIAELETDDV